ncbi:Tripartite-type tricarboxylate transporter, receptor component TctC [Oscillibacter sp. PC13]|uniref:tripartite tricarboxylate transporter substrate binding protein n=1 Tax=Oscillibacter sp. PC13 TaxID=1855299 RepID=UPI0008F10800|nr:tripartite tricarboxylate transporter substrate binding protein [Oscillibacter sp. PC13]SFP37460.1 Tripartite-type tricarboxylate transporter, receptor component TctC [Oscillibacter sp. PC13]
MKRLFAIALTLCMMFSLVACGGNASTEKPAEDPKPAEEADTFDYPTKPVTMMVAWPAGGGSDLLTRAIAADFPTYAGQNMNVTNRDGAGGTIGFAEAVDYENDGYNLLYSTSGVFSAQPLLREVEYTIDDFDFICGVGKKPMSLAVPAAWGVTNIVEWIDYVKANNIEVTVGTSGAAGSIPAFGAEALFPMLAEKGLTNYNIVNYSGAGEVIPALLSGEINCGFFHPHEAQPYVESGDFTCICIAEEERSENFPDLATCKEQGVDFTLAVLEGYIAPTGIDPEIRDYLEETILKILEEGSNYSTYREGSRHQTLGTSGQEFHDAVVAQSELFQTMFG